MNIFLYYLPLAILFLFPNKVSDVYPAVTCCALGFYAFNVMMKRQMFKGAYGTWLLQNNWRPGQPLLRGPILLQAIDTLVLAPYVLVGLIVNQAFPVIPFVAFMLVANVLCLYFYYLQRKLIYIYVSLLCLSVLWVLPWPYFGAAMLVYYVTNHILMSLLQRSWYAKSLLGATTKPERVHKESLPWPLAIQQDAQAKRLRKLAYASAALLSVHLLVIALGAVVSARSYEFMNVLVAMCVIIETVYVIKQVMQYRPPLSLSARLQERRLLLPYDTVFRRAVLGGLILLVLWTQMDGQAWVPWLSIVIPLLLASIYAEAGPNREEWILMQARHVFVLPDAERQKDAPKTVADYYRKYFQQLDAG